ncbi:hypothetical protein RHECNPAF_850076 [Rhizobium etli CNPAF512]|nr:hypothetical protein RHECNPAF_850076 [Rhizobium etli CNPAF512]
MLCSAFRISHVREGSLSLSN